MSEVAVKVEDLSQVKKKISIDVPWNDVKNELDLVYREIGKKAKIKGFRAGKVPRKVLETYFKSDAEGEAMTNLINKYFWKAIDDNAIVALSRPEIEQDGLKPEVGFSFSATFEAEPPIDPQGYTGIDLEKETTIVTDENLEQRLTEIRRMFATMEDVTEDIAARMGDFVVIDFDGKVDGESSPELKSENYMLELGSKRFIPGYEEQIVGMKKGETKDVTVNFPDDYQEQKMAGKEAIFTVTLKELKEQKLPELNEEFIKNFDQFESLDDLKKDIRRTLEEQCKRKDTLKLHDKMIDAVLEANAIEAPASLIERQVYYMMSDTHKRMMMAGMDEKNAMELSFRMHDQFKPEAEKTVKNFLLMKKIAEKESITATDEDFEAHLRELAATHRQDYEVIRQAYEQEERKDNLMAELVQKKVFDFIEHKANIKVVEKMGMEMEAMR